MVSRLKRIVFAVLLVSIAMLGIVQIVHIQERYRPLRMLYSSQSEAQRLLKFLTSYHYQCNETLNSSQAVVWPVCCDPGVGINCDPRAPSLAYCIGPLSDFRFEIMLSQNLSTRQMIFLPKSTTAIPEELAQLNATFFQTTVVANDQADFSRNSFGRNTVNSLMARLGHRRVDILKVVHTQDVMTSYELLYFMAKDGILTQFHQLHTMIDIDKVDDSYLYNWYKTLFTVFHTAGFRLYHTSASSPLCLQVTMMESCRYFVSWVRDPGPQAFVLYPPAIDGSEESEVQRLKDFLDLPPQSDDDVISAGLSSGIIVRLSRNILMSEGNKCTIAVFMLQTSSTTVEDFSALHVKCSVVTLTPVSGKHASIHSRTPFTVRGHRAEGVRSTVALWEGISSVLQSGDQASVVYIDLGASGWAVLNALLDSEAMQNVKQLILVAPVFPVSSFNGHRPAQVLLQRYSELRRITASHMALVEALPRHHTSQGDFWQMSFVKK